jgi:hypothetical protein
MDLPAAFTIRLPDTETQHRHDRMLAATRRPAIHFLAVAAALTVADS